MQPSRSWSAPDFYPRPPRGGRLVQAPQEADHEYFYPRPPRGGRRHLPPERGRRRGFLSTPSARRATGISLLRHHGGQFLSTPSARRATLAFRNLLIAIGISIHALREEGDLLGRVFFLVARKFLSTPSARRATLQIEALEQQLEISIHALREEGDREIFKLPYFPDNFYPRPPRGGRRTGQGIQHLLIGFLSTPSARRATKEP